MIVVGVLFVLISTGIWIARESFATNERRQPTAKLRNE